MSDCDDLIQASKSGYYEKVVHLLNRNFTVHVRDSKQATALYYSCCQGYYDISVVLIQHGSDVNARVQWGSTPLHAAADRGHIQCVLLLIESGADLSIKNNRGDTALHLCAYRGFIEIVKVFIKQTHCDLFAKNNSEKTACDEAEGNNHKNTAYLLRQHMTASTNKSDKNQELPPENTTFQNSNKFVRYSHDLSRLTNKSVPISRSEIEHQTSKRPVSQPVCSKTEVPKTETKQTNQNGRPLFSPHTQRMLDKSKNPWQFQNTGSIENFTEQLQINILKKIEECEVKDRQIKLLQEENKKQEGQIQSLGLGYIKLKHENETLTQNLLKFRENYEEPLTCEGIFIALKSVKEKGQNLSDTESLVTLKETLKDRHMNKSIPTALDVPNREWKVGKDFILLGDKPSYCDGSSLVFHIKHSKEEYLIKIVINQIQPELFNSLSDPSDNLHPQHMLYTRLPYHPNVVTLRHYYTGQTDRFKKFVNSASDGGHIKMTDQAFFMVINKYPKTLRDLEKHLNSSDKRVNNTFLLQLLYQLLSAVSHLQNNGIAHGDIRAENILLDKLWRPLLTGFESAKNLPPLTTVFDPLEEKNHTPQSEIRGFERSELKSRGCRQVLRAKKKFNQSDEYAIGRMFYSLLESTCQPCDVSLSYRGLQWVLDQLMSDDNYSRISPRRAMLCVGMLLFCPKKDDIVTDTDVVTYLQARILSLISVIPHERSPEKVTVEQSIKLNSMDIECNFLDNITPEKFLDIFSLIKSYSLL